jgi:FAD/FMN-containing dehydrogenase
MTADIESWGRFPKARPRALHILRHRDDIAFDELATPACPAVIYGNGRSYGDVALLDNGATLHSRGLDRFIEFDHQTGLLRAEAGVLLSEILELVVPYGWFLPVTPGTQFVSLGGAVANDVHGKNHHHQGSFGHHVTALELIRSDGSQRICSPNQNADWFSATVGGLGLTGLITWVEVALKAIPSTVLETKTERFGSISEFLEISEFRDSQAEYSVAWVDCAAKGRSLGRGRYSTGSFAKDGPKLAAPRARRWMTVPFSPPFPVIRPSVVRVFNAIYHRLPLGDGFQHYQPFLFPLDGIGAWNRLYGRRGFVQHQCVLPPEHAEEALRELLTRIADSGEGSFLAVLKRFGNRPSVGMLSFPRPGVTLALDFPYKGQRTEILLRELDQVVAQVNGGIYPAKDACSSPAMLRQSLPQLAAYRPYRDPALNSDLWRRLEQEK